MAARRWGRRPVRQRFTLIFAALILISAAGVLAVINLLAGFRVVVPAPGQGVSEGQRLVQLRAQLAQVQAAQSRQLLVGSLVALALMAGVSLLVGQAVADRVLGPLRAITVAARTITAENLHARLAVDAPDDEIKRLADTIDDLLERLETAFNAQRRFVANAAHELRTPLATMRAAMDVALAKPGTVPHPTVVLTDRLRDELDRMDALLDGLLGLARAQHTGPGDDLPVQRVPLGVLVGDALADRSGEIARRNLTARTVLDAGAAEVPGNRELLTHLVHNLVDNAIVHNEPGGWIQITTGERAGSTELVVESGGPVLEPGQTARLVEPFRRMGADRTAAGTGEKTGSGLGLSIVAAVVAAHHGDLDLHPRSEGGLRVTVMLPAVRGGVSA